MSTPADLADELEALGPQPPVVAASQVGRLHRIVAGVLRDGDAERLVDDVRDYLAMVRRAEMAGAEFAQRAGTNRTPPDGVDAPWWLGGPD